MTSHINEILLERNRNSYIFNTDGKIKNAKNFKS